MFKVDETVFYPGHGVATITELTEKQVGSSVMPLYKLSFLCKDMTVLLPKHSMQNLGVRYISCEAVIEDACAELRKLNKAKSKNAFDFAPSGWSRRQKEYQLKIQNGLLVDMASVYRDIMVLSFSKDLSFGEKSVLSLVEDLMSQEIAFARRVTRESVSEMLRRPFRESSIVSSLIEGALGGTAQILGQTSL